MQQSLALFRERVTKQLLVELLHFSVVVTLPLPGILVDIVLLGAFGGFYSVPLYALIQQRSERSHLSRIIAANNILNAIFMVGAFGLSIALLKFGFTIP